MKRILKTLVLVFVVGAAISSVVGVVAFKTTSQSSFCKSCHIMTPYYESWQKGPHHTVECTQCHMPPGIKGKVVTKFQALSQLTKYITRTYGTRPWGRIDDASCTACHDEAKLLASGSKRFGRGIVFAHGPHLAPKVRAGKLRCTTCHTQVERSVHMQVALTSCYTCHFKPGADGALTDLARCSRCHSAGMPDSAFASSALAHSRLAVRAMNAQSDCVGCHRNIVQGDGAAPAYRCMQCHLDRKVLDQRAKPEDVHRTHVTIAGAPCFQCHTEITHAKPAAPPPERVEDRGCRQCHGSAHDEQAQLFAGRLGTPGRPSGMQRAGLTCSSCHEEAGGKLAVQSQACSRCHTERLNGVYLLWQDGINRILDQLDANLKLASGSTVSAIAAELAVLRRARPIHNVPHARTLIEDLDRRIRAATPAAASAQLAPLAHLAWDQSSTCIGCHYASVLGTTGYHGTPFSHEKHRAVVKPAKCETCHDPAGKTHGALTQATSCNACHHPEQKDKAQCASCHSDQRAVYSGQVAGLDVKPVWGDKACTACHKPAARETRAQMMAGCVKCHDEGTDQAMLERMKTTTARLSAARKRLTDGTLKPKDLTPDQARTLIWALERDKSAGAHHPALYDQALDRLEGK